MSIHITNLSEAEEKQFLNDMVNCFNHAKNNREAIFHCNTKYLKTFLKMSYNSSEKTIQFAMEAIRITTLLFQENLAPKEPIGIEFNQLDPEEQRYYKLQLKKALI